MCTSRQHGAKGEARARPDWPPVGGFRAASEEPPRGCRRRYRTGVGQSVTQSASEAVLAPKGESSPREERERVERSLWAGPNSRTPMRKIRRKARCTTFITARLRRAP